jgi:hypothetical protein
MLASDASSDAATPLPPSGHGGSASVPRSGGAPPATVPSVHPGVAPLPAPATVPSVHPGVAPLPALANAGIKRFDAQDERAMAVFCAQVAVMLKRHTVELALLKAVADSRVPSASASAFASASATAPAAAAVSAPAMVSSYVDGAPGPFAQG